MTNQYLHQDEMDEVLTQLKNLVTIHEPYDYVNPFAVICNYIENNYDESLDEFTDENFSVLNDLEEAAVLKSFGLWYQNKFRDQDYFGNIRR